MKRGLSRGFVLVLVIASAGLLQAQVRTPSLRGLDRKSPAVPRPIVVPQGPTDGTRPETPVPPISGLGTKITRDQAQAMTILPNDDVSNALRLVIHFLQLRADQVEGLRQLLQLRREAVVPLLHGIVERERRLHELLSSGGDPADIGQLIIEIHHLYQLIVRAQQDFIAGFAGLLDQDQRQRLATIRLAVELQPLLPAFRRLHLL